jgi:hypothetical protein
MFVVAGIVGGVLWGVFLARRQGGRKLDALQYAAGFGILFGILGVFLTIATHRMLMG